MKVLLKALAVLCLLTAGPAVWGSAIAISAFGGGDTITVSPGSSFDLFVGLTPGSGESICGLAYTLSFESGEWTLAGREYGDYGWLEGGYYDLSSPGALGTYPLSLDGSQSDPPTDTVDIAFQSSRADFVGVTTITSAERLSIAVPLSMPVGTYSVGFGAAGPLGPFAYDSGGDPLAPPTMGGPLLVFITPEPGSMVLLGAGILAVAMRRRTRRQELTASPAGHL